LRLITIKRRRAEARSKLQLTNNLLSNSGRLELSFNVRDMLANGRALRFERCHSLEIRQNVCAGSTRQINPLSAMDNVAGAFLDHETCRRAAVNT
jgi:hypothetical protein